MWREELSDLTHGVGGALLFGVPVMYTMEVWWIGSHVQPWHMLLGLLVTYIALLAVNRASGFRRHRDQSLLRSATDSVESLALGLLVAAACLWLLRRINADVALKPMLGQIVLEGIPFAIGVGIASGLFRDDDNDDQDDDNGNEAESDQANTDNDTQGLDQQSMWKATLADAGSTALGATIVAFSIAPTDEVPMIASGLSPLVLLVMVAFSLVISYMIVFVADFGSQDQRREHRGFFQSPLTETIFSYIISLVLTAVMLLMFKQLTFDSPLQQWVGYVITLGFPATVGGAAGRLAI